MAEKRAKRLLELVGRLRVEPGSEVELARDYDPAFTAGWLEKEEGAELLQESVELMSEYQERLAADRRYGVLVVLQALDAGGKDGTIRHVMSGVNPQGVVVHAFKAPTPEELEHDFLWRYATRLPARGQIGIFNRSHYEEVLVVRVHPELLAHERLGRDDEDAEPDRGAGPGHVWKRRFRDINAWERHLREGGFRVVKLLLHISREEQRRRFLRRIDRPEKNWKFSANDVRERAFWDRYQEAFSDMLSHTSTAWAPWHVIPADHKWFARLAVSAVLLETLIDIDPRRPTPSQEARRALLEAKAELEAEAPRGASPDPFEDACGRPR